MQQDKYELCNRAEDPGCAGVKAELRQLLLAWQAQTDDETVFAWANHA